MTKIIGIDPGKLGAIVKIDPDTHTISLHRMPTVQIRPGEKTKVLVDPNGVGNILYDHDIARLYLEEVNARPGEGVVSTFSLGRAFGVILGVCGGLNIPLQLVRPAVWKHRLKVPADKDAARYRASQLFPECSKYWSKKNQDGIAEATLIAFYGMCEMGYQVKQKFVVGETDL